MRGEVGCDTNGSVDALDGCSRTAEVDAIEPNMLRAMVREVIERHIDPSVLKRTQTIEQAERETLQRVIANLNASPNAPRSRRRA
jgi:hypothetical protein